ncbi:ubiquinol-cytochrome C chaperone family protein [Coralliovum pocilloporae]|uniref:ubiquinol-cytochrome C chaperone family protein n=1 Tax=Coralliovum pocilloporae TaxID=3066369 RepID=UPI003306CE7E
MIFGLFRRNQPSDEVHQIYGVIVAQARQPSFYTHFGINDTVTGRFDMIVLHAFLLFHRLSVEDEAKRTFGQKVFDLMFKDMDRSLREMGVGDISVPKKVKKMVQAFYGRCQAYGEAVSPDAEPGALAAAVSRNLFPDDKKELEAQALADYIRKNISRLSDCPVEEILSGQLSFADPEQYLP